MTVNITKPNVGETTKKALIDLVIDAAASAQASSNFIYNQTNTTPPLINGSFELDITGSGVPDGWDLTLLTGGAGVIDTADQIHGQKSFKFTCNGSGANGGGYLTTADFIPVNGLTKLYLSFSLKCSNALSSVKVTILYYDGAASPSFISSDEIYNSTSNPTSWEEIAGSSAVPSSARQMKVKILGGDTASPAGTIAFDNVYFFSPQLIGLDKLTVGSGTYENVKAVYAVVEVYAGGGGGGKNIPAVNGTDGGDSSFGSLSATGGGGGKAAGADGSPGTGSGGNENITASFGSIGSKGYGARGLGSGAGDGACGGYTKGLVDLLRTSPNSYVVGAKGVKGGVGATDGTDGMIVLELYGIP